MQLSRESSRPGLLFCILNSKAPGPAASSRHVSAHFIGDAVEKPAWEELNGRRCWQQSHMKIRLTGWVMFL